jgi:hypothetical protein
LPVRGYDRRVAMKAIVPTSKMACKTLVQPDDFADRQDAVAGQDC